MSECRTDIHGNVAERAGDWWNGHNPPRCVAAVGTNKNKISTSKDLCVLVQILCAPTKNTSCVLCSVFYDSRCLVLVTRVNNNMTNGFFMVGLKAR